MGFYAMILAAGRGSRMCDEAAPAGLAKVLCEILGRPMIAYVIDAVRGAGVSDISIIVGYGADQVRRAMGGEWRYILQEEQLGSGHAVACAKAALGGRGGHAIVMCGDSPLFTTATITRLKERHVSTGATITLVSAVLDDPAGYGRIKRDASARVVGVVEERCAGDAERALREINGGAYAFESRWLWDNIESIERNDAGELNLTDLVRVAVAQGNRVEAVEAPPEEVMGVNTPADLARATEILSRRVSG